MTFGDLTTSRSWSAYVQDLKAVFSKWGIEHYFIPTNQEAKRAGFVEVVYEQHGHRVALKPDRWSPDTYMWDIRSLAAIYLHLDALRKAEARGLVAGAAQAAMALAALPPPARERSPYEVLGVSEDADPEVVRSAYRALAKKYHTDNKETGDVEKFKELERAWGRLWGSGQ